MTNKKKRKINSSLNKSDTENDCYKCKEKCKNTEKIIKCVACAKFFHIECAKITREEFKCMDLSQWYCSNSCKRNDPSFHINRMSRSSSVTKDQDEEDVASVVNESGPHTLTDVVRSINFLSDRLDAVIEENKQYRKMIQNFQKMETKIYALEYEIEQFKQQKNDHIVLLTGIPEKNNENGKDIIQKVAEKLKISIEDRDIINITRLKSKVQNQRYKNPPPIMVGFNNPMMRNQIFAAKKEVGQIFTKELFPDHNNDENIINIRSFLTTANMNLLNNAKSLKQFGFKFIWFSQNKVLVREGPNTQIHHIKSEIDIIELKKMSKK